MVLVQCKDKANDNGATPHSMPGFGKYWKILEKRRVYIQSLGTSEFSYSGEDTITTRKNLLIRVLWREELKL